MATRSGPHIKKDEWGFTLIELIAVMALLAMALAVALPALDRAWQHYALKADAQSLATLIRYSRQEAISAGQSQSVLFYTNNNSYRILGQERHFLNKGIRYVGNTTFSTRVIDVPACTFLPDGTPRAGGTVTLQNTYNVRHYVIVNPVAGRVRVSEAPPESW
ncbi:MAG: GspH/FimT family pseudopilin [Syntrophomonadaceae bacterium]|jgi:prepilin-type N-terminal cleavage/methylation domain-containing protein